MNKQKRYAILLVFPAVLGLSGLIFYLYITKLFISNFETRGKADIRQIGILLDEGHESLQRIVLRQATLLVADIIIIDGDSNLLADSRKGVSELKGQYIDADVSEAKKIGHTLSLRRDHRATGFLITVAERVTLSEGDMVISVIYECREIGLLFRALLLFLLTLGIIMLVLIFAYGRISVLRYRDPLKEFLRLTETNRGGAGRITPSSDNPEFLALAEQFNNLVDRYNQLILSDNKKYSRINTLLAHLKTGMLMVDRNNTIVMVNDAAEKMLNINKVRLFKIRERDRYSNEILDQILEKCMTVNESLESTVFSVVTPDKMLLELNIDAVFSKYGRNEHSGALVILQDVTEMRRLEGLKDDFVANVSHELKTPLTIINGFVETLKSWDNLEEEDRDTALNIIDIETQRLKKLINELLQLSKINGAMGELRRKKIDPAAVLRDVIVSLDKQSREKSIRTEWRTDKKLKEFYTVSGWFRQIIVNLYDNALKYSSQGGEVFISLSDEQNESGGHELVLKVRDKGMGISSGDLDRVFERFYRGEKRKNRNISGSGLGLTIARHMVEELDGSITVESKKGEGSCFTVRLPDIRENL